MGEYRLDSTSNLETDLLKVRKMNNSEENLDGFLYGLLGEQHEAMPLEEVFDLDVPYKNSTNIFDEVEFKKKKLDLFEKQEFDKFLSEPSLSLAEELLNLKKNNQVNLETNNFNLESIAQAQLENEIIENSFIHIFEKTNQGQELTDRQKKLLIQELSEANEKVDSNLEEEIYKSIIDTIPDDKSLINNNLASSYSEIKLQLFDQLEIEIDKQGNENLNKESQILLELVNSVSEQSFNEEEFTSFNKLMLKKDHILLETMIDIKQFDQLNPKTLELINKASNVDFAEAEKEEFSAYLLIDEKGFNYANTFLKLKEADRLTEKNRELMYKNLGLDLFSEELEIDLSQTGIKFKNLEKKNNLEKRLKILDFIEKPLDKKDIFSNEDLGSFLQEMGKYLNLKPPISKKTQKDFFKKIIDNSDLMNNIHNLVDKEKVPEGTTYSVMISKGLKGQLKDCEISLFISMVGRDNLLKYGLEGYPLTEN